MNFSNLISILVSKVEVFTLGAIKSCLKPERTGPITMKNKKGYFIASSLINWNMFMVRQTVSTDNHQVKAAGKDYVYVKPI